MRSFKLITAGIAALALSSAAATSPAAAAKPDVGDSLQCIATYDAPLAGQAGIVGCVVR